MSRQSQKPMAQDCPTGKLPDQPCCGGVVWHSDLSLEGASWLCRQGHLGWGGTGIFSSSAPTGSMAQLAQPTCLWESSRTAKGSRNLARAYWCLACAPSQDAWVLCLALLLTCCLILGNSLLFCSPHFFSWSKFLGPRTVSLITTACTLRVWTGHAFKSGRLTGSQWTVCSRLYMGFLMVSRWRWRCGLWTITS